MKAGLPCIAAACLLAAPLAARAEPPGDPYGWQIELTPYMWSTDSSGTSRIGTESAADKTTFAGQGSKPGYGLRFEAGAYDSGFWIDAAHSRLARGSGTLRGTQRNVSDLDGQQDIVQAAGAARIIDGPDFYLDLIGGARYVQVQLDQREGLGGQRMPAGFRQDEGTYWGSQRAHWTDGFAGVRLQQKLSDRWWLSAYADAGGGGSKLTWQGQLGMDFRVSEAVTVKFGYRVLLMQYDKPDLLYDVRNAGGFAALALRF